MPLTNPQTHALENDVLRLFIEHVTDYAIFLLTPTGEVCSWNPGAERIKGYKAIEILGRHFRVFYPAQDIASEKPEHELEAASELGRFEDEGWRLRKDGSRFWANVVITAIRDRDGHLVGFGKVTRDLTDRREKEQQLRKLTGRLMVMQDEERGRLGRELHDTVGQYLIAAKMSLESLTMGGKLGGAQLQKALEDSIRMIDRCVQEVRTLSYLLYPPMLEEAGLAGGIRWYLEGFSKRSGIKTLCDMPDDLRRLPRQLELALFRVLQESLTNVHRHSESGTVRIRCEIRDREAVLEIEDKGKGMQAGVLNSGPGSPSVLGVGIRGMYERLAQVGGRLEINSTERGTTVRASVPVES